MPKSSSKKVEKAVEELTYEEALAELEEVVNSLEGEQGQLEEAIKLFERGQALASRCGVLLEAAELKVKQVVGRFALVHSIDRLELAEEFARRIPSGIKQRVLVEVNCSGESQKAGVLPESLPGLLEALVELQQLTVDGLMTMAPFTNDEAVQRSTFRRLRILRDEAEHQGHRLPHLSMGMSGDYGVAVEEGATMVRLGTILFGERVQ